MGAAASKLVVASIGDISTVFNRSPAHKHYTFADVDWVALPPVFKGRFHVAEIADMQSGLNPPIAAATWAFVLPKVGQRIRTDPASACS